MLPDPIVTPEADAQIQDIETWWQAHRTAAPDLFREELAEAFLTIRTLPHMGRSVRHPIVKGIRRVLLRESRYPAYYVTHADTVFILAVWSAVRGSGPPLSGVAP
jgi:plasmid stabilization system protein ParE